MPLQLGQDSKRTVVPYSIQQVGVDFTYIDGPSWPTLSTNMIRVNEC